MLVQKCESLLKNKGEGDSIAHCASQSQVTDKTTINHLSPIGSQSIFADCDHQWLQSMIDYFITEDCNSTNFENKLVCALPDDEQPIVSQLSQQLQNANRQTQTPCSNFETKSPPILFKYIPDNSVPTTTNGPPAFASQHSRPSGHPLFVLSHNDILRLANILQLHPDALTSAIEMLQPKVIQPVDAEFNKNENQIDFPINLRPMSSSEGSAISATPPSQLR